MRADIPASSPANATARPRTAVASPASTKCSKEGPTVNILITPLSVRGSTATTPTNWTYSRLTSPLVVSPPAAHHKAGERLTGSGAAFSRWLQRSSAGQSSRFKAIANHTQLPRLQAW